MRRGLDAGQVIDTLERLRARIVERFPNAGLAAVCGDLIDNARSIDARARRLAAPFGFLRLAVLAVVLTALTVPVLMLRGVSWSRLTLTPEPASMVQGMDAAMHLLVLAGAAIFFLVGLETRLKRSRALRDLHELRSFAHVIDMHQLTKDPTVVLSHAPRTPASPARAMTRFELTRYLDYCAEMLSLIGKLAALYSEFTRDAEIVAAVNAVEELSTSLGRKIWQKITILSQLDEEVG